MSDVLRSVARFISRRILPRATYPVFVGPLRGARFILGTLAGEGGGASVYINAVEPRPTSALINTLKRGQTFFDIGANVGYYTILGSRLVGEGGSVVAIEPDLRNLFHLYQHVTMNKADNVTIVAAACADTLSVAAFSPGMNCATGHLASGIDHHGNRIRNGSGIVSTVTLDEVVRRYGVAPDVVKIDVEGAEYLVLKGAEKTLLKARPKIFLSVHSEELRSMCLEFLENLDYAFDVLSQDECNPTEFLAT